MKTVISLNGEKLRNYKVDKSNYYIACDGGYEYLKENGIEPDFVLGDFDSLGFIPEGAEVFSSDKNYTDGELGLMKALSLNPDFIEFINVGGGRDDQFFANVGLLEKATKTGVKCKAITNAGDVYFVKDEISVNTGKGKIVSVYPLEKSVLLSSEGLKYPFNGFNVERGDTLGISNESVDDVIYIKIRGAVLLFVNEKATS